MHNKNALLSQVSHTLPLLLQPSAEEERPHVQCVVSLFLLSQVFLIMHHAPLVRQLARIIFHAQRSVFSESDDDDDGITAHRNKTPVSWISSFFHFIRLVVQYVINDAALKYSVTS